VLPAKVLDGGRQNMAPVRRTPRGWAPRYVTVSGEAVYAGGSGPAVGRAAGLGSLDLCRSHRRDAAGRRDFVERSDAVTLRDGYVWASSWTSFLRLCP
jgi:hypothetical protein